MDNHRNKNLQSTEDLKQLLLYTSMELETTRLAAQEEIKKRDDQISILNQLLNRAIKQRDEALQKSQPLSEISSVEEEEHAPVPKKPLPEKGKLLQAVMKAGPLLQTLLVAGPLPEWRHPPPALEAFEIPPVGIGGCESGGSSGSGVAGDGSSPTRPYKYQRVAS